ncbi:hypothetical protein [Arsenicibacter rosenii]|uniref:Uncharacterized protein n=1 Tax=Arsenicibacter rosenii TaxID=1750698 RepID=A0A1S2VDE8_9BACT|nr:hypothetical protein [Arsenicibacter rosenii]OIN56315.1 hypothetical protein BLX24_25105 [Arsenicibacter rosenii]
MYNQHTRKQTLKNTLNSLMVWGLYLLSGLSAIFAFVRFLSIVLPASCVWLSDVQLEKIDSMLKLAASGSAGALVMKYFQKNADLEDK